MSNAITILDILTMDEIETLEQATGKEINELFGKGSLSAKATKLMVWLLQKRHNPEANIEQVGKMTFVESAAYIQKFVEDPKVRQ